MIFTRLGPEAPFYRALTPRWAHRPQSGEGAAAMGGRFNRPGVDARYLAETVAGAPKEYQQESPLLAPATLATYLVTAERVVDFSGGYTPERWSPLWGSVLQLESARVSGGH
jgi:RES domain-containing protein